MSKSKDQTESTLPLSSAENTEERAQPLSLSVKTDNTPTSTQSTNLPSSPMLSEEKQEPTTSITTEKARQHALVAKVALLYLLKIGLAKRFTVLSKESQEVKEIQIIFDPSIWTEGLDLK